MWWPVVRRSPQSALVDDNSFSTFGSTKFDLFNDVEIFISSAMENLVEIEMYLLLLVI